MLSQPCVSARRLWFSQGPDQHFCQAPVNTSLLALSFYLLCLRIHPPTTGGRKRLFSVSSLMMYTQSLKELEVILQKRVFLSFVKQIAPSKRVRRSERSLHWALENLVREVRSQQSGTCLNFRE